MSVRLYSVSSGTSWRSAAWIGDRVDARARPGSGPTAIGWVTYGSPDARRWPSWARRRGRTPRSTGVEVGARVVLRGSRRAGRPGAPRGRRRRRLATAAAIGWRRPARPSPRRRRVGDGGARRPSAFVVPPSCSVRSRSALRPVDSVAMESRPCAAGSQRPISRSPAAQRRLGLGALVPGHRAVRADDRALVALAGEQDDVARVGPARRPPRSPLGRSAMSSRSWPRRRPAASAPARDRLEDRVAVLAARVLVGHDDQPAALAGDPAHQRPLGRVPLAGRAEDRDQPAAAGRRDRREQRRGRPASEAGLWA